ncbi:MAG: sugar ABC transporter ATP-binding protein, partial [Nitrospirae bacterium]|nr:sugar ABC transporter ATP-binding protein [Nitrospirota bacterium]
MAEPLLAVEGLSKAFPGVQALRGVDFDVRPGEVHALIGENGAGKSTLIKILAGAHRRDAGRVLLRGREVDLRDPHEALAEGLSVIYQEFNLVPTLSVAQNIFLGREPGRGGWIDRGAIVRQAVAMLADLGVRIDPRVLVRTLGVAERQMVEITKALSSRSAQVLIMDEPTAPLTNREIEILFGVIRRLKAQGIGIIYISHRLEEVFAVADRVTVLRDGARILTEPVTSMDIGRLVFAMVGRHLEEEAAAPAAGAGGVVLEADGLTDGQRIRAVSLRVHAGEVVGLAGLVGSGRSELAHLLFGATRATAGSVRLDGRDVGRLGVGGRIAAGIGMVPEDRKLQGLILQLTVRDNATLATLGRYSRWGLLRRGVQERGVVHLIEELRIHTRGPRHPVRSLSGGNQQKVILARWLDAGARALILDEPTRGVDVGAKAEIYALIRRLQGAGAAILLISSDLPEVLR